MYQYFCDVGINVEVEKITLVSPREMVVNGLNSLMLRICKFHPVSYNLL